MTKTFSFQRRHLLAAAAFGSLPAWSQGAFPSRPLTVIVPYTAGGASDVGARLYQKDLSRILEQPVVIENVAGAGGALGVQKLIRSPADGHTLLYGSLSECVLVPLINPSAGYRPEDLSAVAMAGATPAAFVVRSDFPASDMSQFIAHARRNPGRLSYGSPGIGTFQHLVAETVKARTGTFVLHIPYRGGANIVNDVLSGQIDVGVTTLPNVVGLVAQGKLKVLGITSAQRVGVLPQVAGLDETPELKGLDLQTWGIFFAPRGTPDAVLARLNAVINSITTQPEMVEARRKLGSSASSPMSPAQAQAFVLRERDTYRPAASRVKPE